MTDKATVADAIKAAPEQASEALLAIQASEPSPMTLVAFDAVARLLNRAVEDVAVDEIDRRGLLETFAFAMRARGIDLEAADATLADAAFPADRLNEFIARARAFRCRIL